MLVQKARVRDNEWVLIWGIGGGVALAAFEICRALGARTIATSSRREKLERVRALGADMTINHCDEDVVAAVNEATDGAGADVVVETVGEATWERSLRAARRMEGVSSFAARRAATARQGACARCGRSN